jgi:GxxExxY protein
MAPEEDIGRAVIGAAIEIHIAVGPGLLESAYEACLIYELEKQRLRVQRQLSVPLRHEEIVVEQGYRLDLLVDGLVVVELKTVPTILPVHRAQLLSYLRLGGFKLGFLLNFHVAQMRDGILRMVNGL